MPKPPIKTYSIAANQQYTSQNIPQIELPSRKNNIRILITEPTQTQQEAFSHTHVTDSNPTSNTSVTQIKTHDTKPTIETIEIPHSNHHNFDRGTETDLSNLPFTNRITRQQSFSTSNRYIETDHIYF